MVAFLAARLRAEGHFPAVLLRGYRAGQTHGSDEAELLKSELSSVWDEPGSSLPVEADADRAAGARRVLSRCPRTTVFLLDDGFQHRQIHRDLDFVLVDATRPFGFGWLLPRGLLREPAGNLVRADGVIVTRADQVEAASLASLDERIRQLTGRPPIAHARHCWTALRCGEETRPVEHLRRQTVAAVCGIGNPGAFEEHLRRHCGGVLWVKAYNDHHPYSAEDVAQLMDKARADGAQALVMTEKDWVKWRPVVEGGASVLPIMRPGLSIQFVDGEEAVMSLIRQRLQAWRPGC
jgi:tetraacyldisaccharide 4'-kinase